MQREKLLMFILKSGRGLDFQLKKWQRNFQDAPCIKEVSYGRANDEFGGCGSILSLHSSGFDVCIRNWRSDKGKREGW
ncbi:hypothetical protein BT93_J0329 [Corymbia citriodora subsp. variegata]|nr:hypothetical protein BT93_J0329 [Corymbia citriodora subsp. variegata]